jgi:hypothetical protein
MLKVNILNVEEILILFIEYKFIMILIIFDFMFLLVNLLLLIATLSCELWVKWLH